MALNQVGLERLGTSVTDKIGERKNLIINGAMQVAQRGTSVTSSATSGQYIVDRFFTFADATDQASFTHAQVSDAPTGFSKSFKLSVGTAETTLDANEALQFLQRIEAQDLQQLDNGLSTAKSVTLSFYVKSYQTGTFNVNLYKSDNTVRHISATYTVNQSATWEKKTITFAGDTSGGGIDDDNGNGLSVYWHLAAGSNFTSADSTSWGNYSAAGFAYGQAVNLMSSTNNYWQITGVQLEVGSVATDFEHRSFGQELALCQRYFCKNSGGSDAYVFPAKGNGSSSVDVGIPLCVPMRASPSVTCSASRFFRSTTAAYSASSTNPSIAQYQADVQSFLLAIAVGGQGGVTNNEAGAWTPHNSALLLDAEL